MVSSSSTFFARALKAQEAARLAEKERASKAAPSVVDHKIFALVERSVLGPESAESKTLKSLFGSMIEAETVPAKTSIISRIVEDYSKSRGVALGVARRKVLVSVVKAKRRLGKVNRGKNEIVAVLRKGMAPSRETGLTLRAYGNSMQVLLAQIEFAENELRKTK